MFVDNEYQSCTERIDPRIRREVGIEPLAEALPCQTCIKVYHSSEYLIFHSHLLRKLSLKSEGQEYIRCRSRTRGELEASEMMPRTRASTRPARLSNAMLD